MELGRDFSDRTDMAFVGMVQNQLGIEPPRALGLRMAVGRLAGLEGVLREGQQSRLDDAVGRIAAIYGPEHFTTDPTEISGVTLNRLTDGRHLSEEGLPTVYVETNHREDEPPTTFVRLQYVDPGEAVFANAAPPRRALPAVMFQRVGDEAFDLVRQDRRRIIAGMDSLSLPRGEHLVTAVAVVSEVLCSDALREMIRVRPGSPYPTAPAKE